jgi:ATP-dependent Lon protease
MNASNSPWSTISVGLQDTLNRQSEELYSIHNARIDEEGLISCPVLPLRDVVLFPNLVTPLFVANPSSLLAISESIQRKQTMIAAAQRDPKVEDPGPEDLFSVATEIAVGRLMNLPEGSSSVLTQGRRRVEIVEFVQQDPYLVARARPIQESSSTSNETLAMMRAVLTLFEKSVHLNRSLPEEAYLYALGIEEPGWLGDLIVSSLNLALQDRQKILETIDPGERLQRVSLLLGRELDLLEIEDKIHTQVQNEVDRSQRELYLRKQMEAIQVELGEGDLWVQEIAELGDRIEHLNLPEETQMRAMRELDRLAQMPAMAPEGVIIRTYLDWLIELPWTEKTEDNLDVRNAASVLENDHHALDKAKDRILEYIAVRSLARQKQKQPILCFVGPPGTGKTSFGKSIAKALGREFVRLSLGGVRDEAEIRGHRRTYIGAMPGRIIQSMHRAKSINPLFMLDEIDKLGHDFRGDPAAALLEVLDPEQNHAFSDHYLELDYDLSKVMFITTANTLDPVPPALLDRMEVIEFPGYIDEEKVIIAKDFLVPRQLERNGFQKGEVLITEPALRKIIREYTWEAGVRNLEREIGSVFRKLARRKAEGKKVAKRISASMVARFLGPPKIIPHLAELEDQIGVATALAWTENGGESMPVEVLLITGKGELQITGQIGDVMQESAQAALSYLKSRAQKLKFNPDLFEKMDIHIHIPEGSIPKDGPSAGITIATALASALTGRLVRHEVGMSGEITLRGRVLPIGGIREKVYAAYRLKLETVLLPQGNKNDLVEIPKKVRSTLDIRFVSNMDQVLDLALIAADPHQLDRSPKKRGKNPNLSPTAKD